MKEETDSRHRRQASGRCSRLRDEATSLTLLLPSTPLAPARSSSSHLQSFNESCVGTAPLPIPDTVRFST